MTIFQQLNESLVLAVLSWLDTQSIVNYLCCNRELYGNQSLWRLVCAKQARLSYEQVPFCANYRELCASLLALPTMTLRTRAAGREVEPFVYECSDHPSWGFRCYALIFEDSLLKTTYSLLKTTLSFWRRCPNSFVRIIRQPNGSLGFLRTQSVYYELTVLTENIFPGNNMSTLSIGLQLGLIDINGFPTLGKHPGWLRNTIGFHSDDGYFFINTAGAGLVDQVPLPKGSTIGMGFHCYSGTVFITLNGTKLAQCSILPVIPMNCNFFPVVGMNKNTKCRVNFGNLPFVYDLEHDEPATLDIDPTDWSVLDRRTGVKKSVTFDFNNPGEVPDFDFDSSSDDESLSDSYSYFADSSESDTE